MNYEIDLVIKSNFDSIENGHINLYYFNEIVMKVL